MPTYNLRADQVPTPILAPAPSIGTPSTPFLTAYPWSPAPGTASTFNQAMAAMVAVCQNGAGGYAILKGLDLFIASGLQIGINPGLAIGDGMLELVASSAVGNAPFYQVNVPSPYTLADNATNYVWLTKTGSLVADIVKTYPAQAKWFLGTVTTLAGAITNIDASGVMGVSGGKYSRRTADIGEPQDAPATPLPISTRTTTGDYVWNGSAHIFQPLPALVQTLAADLVLNALSPTTLILKTNGSPHNVKLPDLTLIPTLRSFSIYNYDAAQTITIKDSAGTTLTSLTAGQSIAIPSYLNTSGVLIWPTGGSYTPGVPVAGPAGATPAI